MTKFYLSTSREYMRICWEIVRNVDITQEHWGWEEHIYVLCLEKEFIIKIWLSFLVVYLGPGRPTWLWIYNLELIPFSLVCRHQSLTFEKMRKTRKSTWGKSKINENNAGSSEFILCDVYLNLEIRNQWHCYIARVDSEMRGQIFNKNVASK